jgi:hypothetical protein
LTIKSDVISTVRRLSFRDNLCHLARTYLLAIEQQRRIIRTAVTRIAELTEQFETDLTATREQERQ